MDATARGIYREMLDACYAQGSVTADKPTLCRKCGCTMSELEARWELIVSRFTFNGTELTHWSATQFRAWYFEYQGKQAANGKLGGRPKKAVANPPLYRTETSGLADGFENVKPLETQPETQTKAKRREEKRREENKEKEDWSQVAFEAFIAAYPNRVKTDQAARSWVTLVDKGEVTPATIPEIMAGLDRWRFSEAWKDSRYIPAPSVFLTGNMTHSGRLWKDFPPPRRETTEERMLREAKERDALEDAQGI